MAHNLPMNRTVLSLGFIAGLVSVSLLAQAPVADVMPGRWTLDPAKSTYAPGPVPKSQVATLTDNPVVGDPNRDAVSVRKLDAYTLEITNKKAGKVTTTIHAAYAKDGRSRVETTTGTNTSGQSVRNVTVWTKTS